MASVIPENINGKFLDIEYHILEDSVEEAVKTFKRACKRLLNPPVWHSIAGELSAKFAIYNVDSGESTRLARINDYFTIDIPGPGSSAGSGFDWVKVEDMQKNKEPNCDESIALKLRASKNPTKAINNVAHFFNEQATSTFIIKRTGNFVSASYHGRNEIENTTHVSLLDKLRNKLVATGAEAGLSSLQWNALIKGFLQPEIGA
jgi:hypothetical protein